MPLFTLVFEQRKPVCLAAVDKARSSVNFQGLQVRRLRARLSSHFCVLHTHTQTHTFSRERTGESESSTSASRLKLKRLHGIESNSTVVYARKLFIKIVLQHIQRSISSCNASPRAGAHTNDVYELESRHTHAYTSRDIPHGLLQTSAYTVVRISL